MPGYKIDFNRLLKNDRYSKIIYRDESYTRIYRYVENIFILWAHKSFSYILSHKDPTTDITHHEVEIDIWNQVFDELFPQMKYLIGIHREIWF
jgi:hypothetical protein